MKTFLLLPLLLLSACATAPKLALRPQPASLATDTVRYPEIIRAYHFGRYADPNDDSLLHEQHTIYRVEENARWDLHPGNASSGSPLPRDAAFSSTPVNDAILAEVNSQRLATSQFISQSRTLATALAQFQTALKQTQTNFQETARLRAAVNEIQRRLAAPSEPQPPTISTNQPDPLRP
jgi:hypothetical protein